VGKEDFAKNSSIGIKTKRRTTGMLEITSERHLKNLKEIHSFLHDSGIEYKMDWSDERVFHLKDSTVQLRYVDTENFKMDYTKRFGLKGIPHNYFIDITLKNKINGIRTIWIKDWEIEEVADIIDVDGTALTNYRRKWNVLKSYIKTASGMIDNRFYGRDCEIRELTNKELRPFLVKNCFYGYRSANKNLGLFLKKEKNGQPKGTLLMIYTFGHPFFSKGLYDIEVIRVGTKLFCQVIGGASKLLKNFLIKYPSLIIGKKEVKVEKIVFIVDADHNSGSSLETLGFKFISHKGAGFMNVDAATGKVSQRKPAQHKQIMAKMAKGEIYSVGNAGSIIYTIKRSDYLGPEYVENEENSTIIN